MIAPALLDYLAQVASSYRPEAWAVERVTEVSTGDGVTTDWATIASAPTGARISTPGRGGAEAEGAEAGLRAAAQRVLWLPLGTDVTPKDRVTVGSRQFEVTDVDPFTYRVELRLDAVELF